MEYSEYNIIRKECKKRMLFSLYYPTQRVFRRVRYSVHAQCLGIFVQAKHPWGHRAEWCDVGSVGVCGVIGIVFFFLGCKGLSERIYNFAGNTS
jgi:hypothetical protein